MDVIAPGCLPEAAARALTSTLSAANDHVSPSKHRAVLELALLALLLAVSACSGRDSALCKQVAVSDSRLDVIVATHALREHPDDDYANGTAALLRSVAPFDTRGVNVYGISLPNTSCNVTTRGNLGELSCDWDAVNKALAACGLSQAKVFLITGEDVQSVSVSAYYTSSVAVVSEKAYGRYAVLHEFGHLLGLQDEVGRLRVQSYSPAFAPRRPDCAPNLTTAQEWWGRYVGINGTGYYAGCAGHPEYIRPNNETLMGNAWDWSDYGYVDTLYLAQAYDCCYAANRSAYRSAHACDGLFTDFPGWAACEGS